MPRRLRRPLCQGRADGEQALSLIGPPRRVDSPGPLAAVLALKRLRLSLPVQAFAVPSLSLFGLECLEGREITTETEILSMAGEGFNNHFLSVRVNSGW